MQRHAGLSDIAIRQNQNTFALADSRFSTRTHGLEHLAKARIGRVIGGVDDNRVKAFFVQRSNSLKFGLRQHWRGQTAVSYTHLTLPTKA